MNQEFSGNIDVNILLIHLKICKDFSDEYNAMFDFDSIQKIKSFSLDYQFLTAEIQWPDFQDELINNTEYVLNCFGLAVHQKICQDFVSKNENVANSFLKSFSINLGKIRPKILKFEPVLQLRELKVNVYGENGILRRIDENMFTLQINFAAFMEQ